MKRGNRGSKKQSSNFKLNVQKAAFNTTSVLFGAPHFVVTLIGHEIAQTEAIVKCLIMSNSKRKFYTALREQQTHEYISNMDDAIEDASKKAGEFVVRQTNKVKNVFSKKPETQTV